MVLGFGVTWVLVGTGLQVPVGVREVLVKVGWSNSGGTSAKRMSRLELVEQL